MQNIESFKGKYAFLSNFYPCQVGFEGMNFPSSEHAFQAAKTTDLEERMHIRSQATPGKAKRAGRKVTLRDDWEYVKLYIMERIIRDKFSERNPELRDALIATGDAELVECNTWHDDFWGVCSCKGCSHVKGQNHLGRILEEVRASLVG